jgi:hypothetical protein
MDKMKGKSKTLLLIFIFLTLLTAACSQGEEDPGNFSGIISEGKLFGYHHIVIKEGEVFTWEAGFKDSSTLIRENSANQEELDHYRMAVEDGGSQLVKLILSVSYLLISAGIVTFLFIKNRRTLKESGPFIAVFAGIALYIAIGASVDLSNSLEDVKYFYALLKV